VTTSSSAAAVTERRLMTVRNATVPWNAHLVVLWATAIIPILIVLWQHGSSLLAFAWIGRHTASSC
jgi:hypothetical protein